MAIIPIRIEPEEIHIRADRRLAFEVVSAFGATRENNGASTRVLQEDGNRLLVEFHTPVKMFFGITMARVYCTVEWVTLHKPDQIDFSLVEGPLQLLEDRFLLEDVEGCTDFRYESTFGVRWSIFGWILGKVWFERCLKQHMRDHLTELRETIEARAKRSRIYALECKH